MNDHSDTEDTNGDGEGVWSPDIEQCFREALLLFSPCGRRKHILQEEGGGKMYGRNELIARHIMMRTGKVRTRKQVSSHIQVLARRKAKAEASLGNNGQGQDSPASSMNGGGHVNGASQQLGSGQRPTSTSSQQLPDMSQQQQQQSVNYYDVWEDRPILTQKIRLVEFSAFIEYRQQTGLSTNSMQPLVNQAFINDTHQQQASALSNLASIATSVAPTTAHLGSLSVPHQQPSPHALHGGINMDLSPAFSVQSAASIPQQDIHPLAANHHLPAQQNQPVVGLSGGYQTNLPLNNNHQHHMNQGTDLYAPSINGNNSHLPAQIQSSSAGFTRHSYVKIDYRQPIDTRTNKLERIDISQIQDKFPEIGGTEGLFQRGPADAFYLVKFWADLNNDYEYSIEDQNSYFGFSSHFETIDPYSMLTCSTKACSYGLQVVEKVEKIYGAFNSSNGRYSYDINRSPMCEFMIQFIKKLRQLPRASQMNSVLENFTVLQVVMSESTSEILLCLAYVFEIASTEQHKGSQYHVYKLTRD